MNNALFSFTDSITNRFPIMTVIFVFCRHLNKLKTNYPELSPAHCSRVNFETNLFREDKSM